jgi:hypothetical protein
MGRRLFNSLRRFASPLLKRPPSENFRRQTGAERKFHRFVVVLTVRRVAGLMVIVCSAESIPKGPMSQRTCAFSIPESVAVGVHDTEQVKPQP